MTRLVVSQLTTAQVQRIAKERLIGTAQLCEILGIRRQTLLSKVERGLFPQPIAVFGKSFVWDITQVKPHFPR